MAEFKLHSEVKVQVRGEVKNERRQKSKKKYFVATNTAGNGK